jgi:hypothetical protein
MPGPLHVPLTVGLQFTPNGGTAVKLKAGALAQTGAIALMLAAQQELGVILTSSI